MTALLQGALALGGALVLLTGYMYWQDSRHRARNRKSSHPAE